MAAADQSPAEPSVFDILVIGGGINGAGVARDAAGRGYSVCLCEAGDFGSGTSSASTKLVHGGLRYLEFYEFRLVREALMEREVLWQMAPHIIWPMRFVLPHHAGLRPRWLLRLGLFLYDHLGGRKLLPPARLVDLETDELGRPLQKQFRKGFEYSDCWVEDSRLVILNLRDAAGRGAALHSRTKVVRAQRVNGCWNVETQSSRGNSGAGGKATVRARMIVNAAGPWVDEVLRTVFGRNEESNVRLVRGSHIVIAKKFDHDRSYIFQNADGRVLFAIPYERDFTLIGTTDEEHEGLETRPAITPAETEYLCAMASEYFAEPVTKGDIVWTYSGVRPLYDDGASKAQEATRDYVVKREGAAGEPGLVNIFGGKITTYRRLAEHVVGEIEEVLGKRKPAWTRGAPLPGGDFPAEGFAALVEVFVRRYPAIRRGLLERLARLYGTETLKLLGNAASEASLGEHFGGGLYEAEVRYLMDNEWALDAEDVLFRRTKLGIRMNAAERKRLADWMKRRGSDRRSHTS